MIPSIYINLDDDVSKIAARLQKEKSTEVVLVCPKRCFLFNDSINLRLLKKQTDLMKKSVSILTMDERGQMYSKEAGFTLKFLSNAPRSKIVSDINPVRSQALGIKKHTVVANEPDYSGVVAEAVKEIKQTAKSVGNMARQPVKTVRQALRRTLTPKISVADNIFPKEIEQIYKDKKRKRHWNRILAGFIVVCLFLGAALYFIILPKAEVFIIPKSENLTRDLEVSVATAIKNPDASRLVLPATKISEEIDLKKKFESKGKKDVGNKATGFVRIYNFTKNPLNLKAATTVLTLGSKSYYLANDIILLKPTGYKNSKTKEINEATLADPVEVVAMDAGESYNVPAGTRLEITNQILGSKPQILYAKTESPISGGTSRYLSVVLESDISNSQVSLKEAILEILQEKLKKQNLFLSDGSYSSEILQFTTDKAAGAQSPNFEASIKLKINGLAINANDLNKLVTDRISQTLASNKVLENRLKDDALAFKMKDLDLKNELGILAVHFQGKVWYMVPNLDDYPKQLKGKTADEVNEILIKRDEVERIDVVLMPSWQKRFPWLESKIRLKISEE